MPVYSNFGQFARQQGRNWLDATDVNKVLRQAVVTLVPVMKNRIQQGGKNSAGGQIGQYSTKTLSFKSITGRFGSIANKKQLTTRMKAFGDTDEFYGGYKEFRASLGRQVDYIDLTLTGAMFSDWKPAPLDSDSYGVGFKSAESAKIAGYHEKRFGPIFAPTDQENKLTLSEINRASQKLLSR